MAGGEVIVQEKCLRGLGHAERSARAGPRWRVYTVAVGLKSHGPRTHKPRKHARSVVPLPPKRFRGSPSNQMSRPQNEDCLANSAEQPLKAKPPERQPSQSSGRFAPGLQNGVIYQQGKTVLLVLQRPAHQEDRLLQPRNRETAHCPRKSESMRCAASQSKSRIGETVCAQPAAARCAAQSISRNWSGKKPSRFTKQLRIGAQVVHGE